MRWPVVVLPLIADWLTGFSSDLARSQRAHVTSSSTFHSRNVLRETLEFRFVKMFPK